MSHHIRRTDREITDQNRIEELLLEGRFCSIALFDADGPYVVTMSYGYDAPNSRLYFHCAHKGRKLDAIAADPRACATVVLDRGYNIGACEHPFESVVLTGRMRIVDDPAEKLHGLRVLIEHLEKGPDAFPVSRLEDSARVKGVTSLALDIESRCAKQGK
jgi:nitroimidazol reductase NimA-like FMN-containing flavoprotein (pyridoxamine 5'-phosphate oxidase superfamily)